MIDKYGLESAIKKTKNQLADIAAATQEADISGLTGSDAADFIKNKVQSAMQNRVGAAESPSSTPEAGAEQEHPDNPHHLSAGDVVLEDKFQECIVTACQQEDTVGSATKRIQIEIDNLTGKVDKMLGARKNYIDAVSNPPNADQIQKEVRATASKVAKFQKIIMDKMAEYDNKKMNQALTKVVAAMPSSMRYLFADQKFLNIQNNVQAYNKITNGMVDQMEGILTGKLDIGNLIKQADSIAASGALWANPNPQSGGGGVLDLSTGEGISIEGSGAGDDVISVEDVQQPRTPKVPMCYAEDVVAQGIAANKDAINEITESQHRNYNRFLEGLKSQLEESDKNAAAAAYDKTNLGKVTVISDEAPSAEYEPIGGTDYYTADGVPCTGGTGTGFKVDIVVSTGGWYDNGFATIQDGGAGYTVNTADGGGVSGTGTTTGASVTGGSGSGIKVNYTISSGVITGITTNTAGSNYKSGDIITIVNNASGTPSTNATFTIDKVRGVISRMSSGGIKIGDPGNGYTIGDVLIVNQQGSGENAALVILQVVDPGEKKASAGPVTPGDTSGSVADSKSSGGQKLGDILQMLGGLSGNMTQALDFKNLTGNIFPFESPPNKAVSDCYTLAKGGSGVPETESPVASSIDKAISKVKDIAPPVEAIGFAIPSLGTPPINLLSDKIGSLSEAGKAAISAQDSLLNLATKSNPQMIAAKAALDLAQGKDIKDVAKDAASDYVGGDEALDIY